jgi:hypothetical protein
MKFVIAALLGLVTMQQVQTKNVEDLKKDLAELVEI